MDMRNADIGPTDIQHTQNLSQIENPKPENPNSENPFMLSGETVQALIASALEARERAYTPYSHYHVGASLLTSGGRIYQGCNVENASYGATNCAERTAIFKAVSEGERCFRAIAIVGGMEGNPPAEYAYPCGICRQVMQEFGESDFQIIVAQNEKEYRIFTLAELLPSGFGGSSIV